MIEQVETNKAKVCLVKINDDAKSIYVEDGGLYSVLPFGTGADYFKINKGNWIFINFLNNITEEQASTIVDECFENIWPDYQTVPTTISSFKKNALESLHSLCDAIKCYNENPFGKKEPFIPEHPYKGTPAYYNEIDFSRLVNLKLKIKQWQEAETRTGNWAILVEYK